MKSAILVNDTSSQNHFGCKLTVKNLKAAFEKKGVEFSCIVPVDKPWKGSRISQALEQSDMVVVNGEGSVHSSRERARRLTEIAPFCKERTKPCFLINSVFENNSEPIINNVKFFDSVFVRESRSRDVLLQHGVDAEVVPDFIFYQNVFRGFAIVENKKDPLVTGSVFKDISNVLFDYSLRRDLNFTTISEQNESAPIYSSISLKRACFELFKELLPVQWRPNINRIFKSKDIDFIFDYKAHSPAHLDQLLNDIWEARFVITGYFHLTCLAMMAQVPFIAVQSNTHKIQGMLEDSGLSGRLLGINEIFSQCHNDFNSEEQVALEQYLRAAPIKIDWMIDKIKLLASDGR